MVNIAEFSYFLICVLRSRSSFCELAKHQNNWCSDWATLQELVEEVFGRVPVIHARVLTERALEWEKWPYGPIVDGWQLWRFFPNSSLHHIFESEKFRFPFSMKNSLTWDVKCKN